jgi:hypothetical protein
MKTSFIQKLPLSHTHYRAHSPLMPLAIEGFDLPGSGAVTKSADGGDKRRCEASAKNSTRGGVIWLMRVAA